MQTNLHGCKEGLETLRCLAENIGKHACLDKIRLNRIALALDELFANIHEHGYGHQGGKIECSGHCIEQDGQLFQLEIIMRDYAPVIEDVACCTGVCPETLKDNPVPGGLGMGLICAVTEVFEHTPLANGNQWRLVFDIQEKAEQKEGNET